MIQSSPTVKRGVSTLVVPLQMFRRAYVRDDGDGAEDRTGVGVANKPTKYVGLGVTTRGVGSVLVTLRSSAIANTNWTMPIIATARMIPSAIFRMSSPRLPRQ